MLNALPMSIFGPLSLLYWIYYTVFDPILQVLGLSGSRPPKYEKVANGHVRTASKQV
jgi:hypothetical protein